jgi:hypothetical protein
LVTLVETEFVQASDKPMFNLRCTEVENMHKKIKEAGYKVTELIDGNPTGTIMYILMQLTQMETPLT